MFMKLLFVLLTITFVLCRLETIIKSDLIGEYIASGEKVTETDKKERYNFPYPQCKWIWDPNFSHVKKGVTRVFIENFTIYCDADLTLTLQADDVFHARINGEQILSGNDFTKVFSTKFSPATKNLNKCGKNSLSITVTNTLDKTPAALVYILQQDQSCIKCPRGTTFNFQTCECQCRSHCDCGCNYQWVGFPDCMCQCKELRNCDSGQYFDEETCDCEAVPILCDENKQWNRKRSICQCKQFIKCEDQVFNQQTCACQ